MWYNLITTEAIPEFTADAGPSGTELLHDVLALPMVVVVVSGSVRIPPALFPAQQTENYSPGIPSTLSRLFISGRLLGLDWDTHPINTSVKHWSCRCLWSPAAALPGTVLNVRHKTQCRLVPQERWGTASGAAVESTGEYKERAEHQQDSRQPPVHHSLHKPPDTPSCHQKTQLRNYFLNLI